MVGFRVTRRAGRESVGRVARVGAGSAVAAVRRLEARTVTERLPSAPSARPLAEVWSEGAAPDVPVTIPPAPAAVGDRGPWEWVALFAEGGDVCSLPHDSYSACERDASDHARRFLAVSGAEFRSITLRRVGQ